MPAHARIIGSRATPEEIQTALEAIDENAELIHLGGKRWWLGVRAPNPKATDPMDLANAQKAAGLLPTVQDKAERAVLEVELSKEFTMRQIMAEGFRPIMLYVVDPAGDQTHKATAANLHEIVEDFRVRDYNHRTKSQQQIERELKQASSVDYQNALRIKEWGALAADKAREAYNYVFRRARSVLVGAFNRGS